MLDQFLMIPKLLAWSSLIFFSYRLRLLKRYPLVFAYVFSSMALEVVMRLFVRQFGINSLLYGYLYVARSLLAIALAAAVLIWIYKLIGGLSWRRDWHLLAGPFALAMLVLLDSRPLWVYMRAVNLGYAVLTYLGVATFVRMRKADDYNLGWNLTVVLFALTVPPTFYGLILVGYSIGLSISYNSLTLWIKLISTAFWIILAAGMTEYSPPGAVATTREPDWTPEEPLSDQKTATENLGAY